MTKFKKQKALPCKFQKKFKGPLFHCREISDHKYWWSGKNFLNILSANWHLLKLWNSIKKNVWYLPSLEKLAIKIWFPFNFAKNLKDRHFVVGGSKNLKLSPNTCFGVSFQKNVFSSFLLFSSVCYQDDLSDSERRWRNNA